MLFTEKGKLKATGSEKIFFNTYDKEYTDLLGVIKRKTANLIEKKMQDIWTGS